MLQISVINQGKSEEEESHVNVPVVTKEMTVKEPNKTTPNALTLNFLDTNQIILTNAQEHGFVIGLDNYKNDLFIVQNPDLKSQSDTGIRNSAPCELTYVDQSKTEILCQNSESNQKEIAKAKHELNSVPVAVKTSQQINLNDTTSGTIMNVLKNNSEILSQETADKNDGELQYVIYFDGPENGSVLPNTDLLKSVKNLKSVIQIINSNAESTSEVGTNTEETYSYATESTIQSEKSNESNNVVEDVDYKTEESNNSVNFDTTEETSESSSNSDSKDKQPEPATRSVKEDSSSNSDSDEPLINIVKNKKNKIFRISPEADKVISDNEIQDGIKKSGKKEYKISSYHTQEFDKNKFKNIYDLLNWLKKSRVISSTVLPILISGLKELKVNIFKEMNCKKNSKIPPSKLNYSPQLKAFALVLYFKQPPAFTYLSHLYKSGWPPLNLIKDWKRQLNRHRSSEVVRRETDIENQPS